MAKIVNKLGDGRIKVGVARGKSQYSPPLPLNADGPLAYLAVFEYIITSRLQFEGPDVSNARNWSTLHNRPTKADTSLKCKVITSSVIILFMDSPAQVTQHQV